MKKENAKILYVASEGVPFIATGGMGEVIGALPRALEDESSLEVRVVMPLYQQISEQHMEQLTYLGYTYIPLSWRNQYCGVFKAEANGVTYYFIDNEYYFKRADCYGHYDDGERFAFFCKAVLSILPMIDFWPDIIHCHDWQSALVPVYLRTIFAQNDRYQNIRSIFTIHNIEYQGKYDLAILSDVFDLPPYDACFVEYDGCINLMKGAIECADIVSTVSPTYAQEIFSPFYSHGLTPIIERNSDKITGILNGIDTNFYNPAIDKALFKPYNVDSMEDKYENKAKLQEMVGLPVDKTIPVIAVISRLVSHKGIDLVAGAAEELLHQNIQLIILGKGDQGYEDYFRNLQYRHQDKVVAWIEYNPEVSRKIYAGADIFLMPSKSEPCGLAQMIASRYGTVPVVRETGGLKDSIRDCTLGEGNGFTFVDYSAYNVVNAVGRALALYYDKKNWNNLMREVMNVDFSWNNSAKEYLKLYDRLL